MRTHYLQHVPFEGLGSIEPWLTAAGCTLTQYAVLRVHQFAGPGRSGSAGGPRRPDER